MTFLKITPEGTLNKFLDTFVQWSFPVTHKVGNVDICVIIFENM